MCALEIAGLRFGAGAPKLCVPLVSDSLPALLREASAVRGLPADLYEWRLDHFSGSFEEGLALLQRELPGKPLLCTLRTRRDGGLADCGPEEYEKRLSALLERGGFALLDIELSCGEERAKALAARAHEKGLGAVVSWHDFQKTPSEETLFSTLVNMKRLGADLPKAAVMPQSPEDVLAMLSATLRAYREIGPVITMSMGTLGMPSRVVGQLFGSCVTFGAGAEASAPGQIGAEDLKVILEKLNAEA